MVENVIIMGAAGRDFHNFNVYFRDNARYRVVCFTATQIPDIDGRCYPATLAGKLYPEGIPIFSDDRLADLIRSTGWTWWRFPTAMCPTPRSCTKPPS